MTDDHDITGDEDLKHRQEEFLAAYRRRTAHLAQLRARVDEDLFGEDALFIQLLNAGEADTHASLRACYPDGLATITNDQLSLIRAGIAALIRAASTGERIDEAVATSMKLLGLADAGDRIRVATDIVRGALSKARSRADERPDAALVRFQLSACDERFAEVGEEYLAELLLDAARSTTSTGNAGRGKKQERYVLVTLIDKVQAFGVSSVAEAEKKFDNAQDVARQRRNKPVQRAIPGGAADDDPPKD